MVGPLIKPKISKISQNLKSYGRLVKITPKNNFSLATQTSQMHYEAP